MKVPNTMQAGIASLLVVVIMAGMMTGAGFLGAQLQRDQAKVAAAQEAAFAATLAIHLETIHAELAKTKAGSGSFPTRAQFKLVAYSPPDLAFTDGEYTYEYIPQGQNPTDCYRLSGQSGHLSFALDEDRMAIYRQVGGVATELVQIKSFTHATAAAK